MLQALLFSLISSLVFFLISKRNRSCHLRWAGTDAADLQSWLHSGSQLDSRCIFCTLLHVLSAHEVHCPQWELKGKTEGRIQMKWDQRAGYHLIFAMYCHSESTKTSTIAETIMPYSQCVQYIFRHSVSKSLLPWEQFQRKEVMPCCLSSEINQISSKSES